MVALGGPWLRDGRITNGTAYDNFDSAKTQTLWGNCVEIEKGYSINGVNGVVTWDGEDYKKWQVSQAFVIMAFMVAALMAAAGGTFLKKQHRQNHGDGTSCRRSVGALLGLGCVVLTAGAFGAFVPSSNSITQSLMDNLDLSYHIGFAAAVMGFILSLWNMALFMKGFGSAISFFSMITLLTVMVSVGGPWLRNEKLKISVNLFSVCQTDTTTLIQTACDGGVSSDEANKWDAILWVQGIAFLMMIGQESLYFVGGSE